MELSESNPQADQPVPEQSALTEDLSAFGEKFRRAVRETMIDRDKNSTGTGKSTICFGFPHEKKLAFYERIRLHTTRPECRLLLEESRAKCTQWTQDLAEHESSKVFLGIDWGFVQRLFSIGAREEYLSIKDDLIFNLAAEAELKQFLSLAFREEMDSLMNMNVPIERIWTH